MIKTILTATAVALTSTPVFADSITAPTASPTVKSSSFGFSSSAPADIVPSLSLAAVNINNNISCRARARAKYFELGARDMSRDDSNAQWGTVGNMQAVVWCRDTQAVIAVTGASFNSVTELRDEIRKVF